MYRKILFTAMAFTALIFTACNSETKENDADKNATSGTAFRKGDLFSEDINLGDKSIVTANDAGNNEKIDRSFENAPPLISHKIEGFVPITLKNNMCLSCHQPGVMETATDIPPTHFTKYRPDIKKVNGKYQYSDGGKLVVSEDLGKLNSARYNCTQCHVIQTNAKLDVSNTFKAEFRNPADKTKSDLKENIDEGVK